MSLIYSQELVDSPLVLNEQECERLGSVKLIPSAAPFSKNTGQISIAMMTSKHSKEQQLTLFAAVTHASPFQKQESNRLFLTKDTSGRKCLELYKASGRSGLLPKMFMDILNLASVRYAHSWRMLDTKSGRLLFQLAPLAHHTEGTEFGFWPTPCAAAEAPNMGSNKRNGPRSLIQVAREMWPIPPVGGNYNRKGASKTSGDGLATAVGGKLNPEWVEWLMGYPTGWTDLKPSEMPLSRKSHKSSVKP